MKAIFKYNQNTIYCCIKRFYIIFGLTTERDDTVSDRPPHPQAMPVLRRDDIGEVDSRTALARANSGGAAVNGLHQKPNEPQRPTVADENCARWMGEMKFFLETIEISASCCRRLQSFAVVYYDVNNYVKLIYFRFLLFEM